MSGLGLVGKAAAMFAVTNIDDIVVLAVLFGRAARRRPEVLRVIAGHYFGFVGILAVSALGALGASLLPERAIAYLGILPLLLGVRAAWQAWRPGDDGPDDGRDNAVGILGVAAVTFANGGDNIGVYVPVFAVAGIGGMLGSVAIFLVGVALWCVAGIAVTGHPAVATVLSRWGHVIVPVVLIAIGLSILVQGGVFAAG
ncbi:cadmium resistance transporter [Mycolicibacterium pallens]